MHLFLRSVGFSEIDNDNMEEKLIIQTIQKAIASNTVLYDESHGCSVVKTYFGEGFGIIIKGKYDGKAHFKVEYYYPFLDSENLVNCAEITVERHADKDSYAIACDEVKVGVTLIFYLENIFDYYRYMSDSKNAIMDRTISISAFSREGRILLPVNKSASQIKKAQKDKIVRNKLIAAARQGDEEALENLTIEEMDTYNRVNNRIRIEDLYSIVDTTFMPCGVECDQYSVIGTILECERKANILTGELMWLMVVECNDLTFRTIINDADLLGEPQVGRRFKGRVWMCAHVNFE